MPSLLRPLVFAIILLTLPAAFGQPVEPWSDTNLKVTQGLQVWIDSHRLPQAYASANRKGGTSGNPLDTLFDASGNQHDFQQDLLSSQPRLVLEHGVPVIDFDGVDDFARTKTESVPATAFSLYILASIEANPGNFPALLSAASYGQNDYITGLNVDLGSAPTPGGDPLSMISVEGNGFSGMRNLLKTPIPFSKFHLIELHRKLNSNNIELVLDGVAQNSRDATAKPIDLTNLWLGCRYYSNTNEPAHVSGFVDGKIAELLLYNRTLDTEEAITVRTYLLSKHAGLISGNSDRTQGYLLQPLTKTPVVQMLLPGFAVDELPLSLTNINNIRYRRDGKLIAVGYNGNIFVLSDTDSDGIEETSKLFWDNQGRLRGPIGIALTPQDYPHGNGVIVASKGKVSLILDSNGDDVADEEKIIATGWKEISQNVDAIGVAIAPDHSIYFGLGAANYANGYLIDGEGKSQFDLASERGTVQRISPDWSKRESICTGVRFPVAMAFNEQGDLFASEQEGATWLPNGNPLDELLHIQTGRHYGFPPRHPKHLPNVIDEPSVFDYAPQHQSTCGFIFNLPTENSDKIFGPSWWRGDAIVCGESRGKLFRTKTIRTSHGYVAQNQLIGCLNMLTVDACVSPRGDLIVACHSGPPDWGTGPEGKGKLMRVRYIEPESPQVVATWASSDREIAIAFDRSVDPVTWKNALNKIQIEGGVYVAPGDRFEVLAPPYAVVQKQLSTLRYSLPVYSIQSAPDGRTIRLLTAPLQAGFRYAIQLPDLASKPKASPPATEQLSDIDMGVDLHGVEATWTNSDRTESF